MYIPDDDVLNVLNNNTNNNTNNEYVENRGDDVLNVLNENTQNVATPKKNRFGISLNDDESNARTQGYVESDAGVVRTDYDDLNFLGGENKLFNPKKLSRNYGNVDGVPVDSGEEENAETGNLIYEEEDDSASKIYEDILGVTQYSDLRKACGLSDNESYTDFYNRTKYVPKGYEVTARLLLAEEKVKKIYSEYKNGDIGYSDFLYRAYGKDIMKSQGIDVESTLYWYNKAKNKDYSNPLDSNTFLADVLAMADQKFQAETWYEYVSVDNLKNNALVIASGGEVTAENLREIFKDQIDTINKYFESEEKFIKLYKAGMVDLSMFNPFIDIDNDGVYDYYFAQDGKLYAAEGSSGTGNNVCKIYYETDAEGNKVVDRVTTHGIFGTSEFADVLDSFVGSFSQVFTGLIDFGAQIVGLIGHAAGNDDIMLNWNAFKNNNLLFGGTNTKDFGGFNISESDDWFRSVSSAAGTIVGMIAAMGLTSGVSNVASIASKAVETAGAAATTAMKVRAGILNASAFALRTYSGLRGGNMTSVLPQLAEHAMANRLVTAASLAVRDGVSTANKLIMQNEVLPEDQKISNEEIVGRTMLNIGLNTVVSFGLRAVGDSGVTDFFKGEAEFRKGVEDGIKNISNKVSDEVIDGLVKEVGPETVNAIGATLLGKTINTVGDIVENIITQTNTGFFSKPGDLSAGEYFKTMGGLVANPAFILTNLYIAKQDMGFKLLGRDPKDGKIKLMPRTEMNYAKAALSADKNLVDTFGKVMTSLDAKYVELIEADRVEEADALMKGIIEPARQMQIGEQGESTLSSTLKAFTWLCKQTEGVGVDALKGLLSKEDLARLTEDEKNKGVVSAVVLAGLKKGMAEKIISKTIYQSVYYDKAYKQIYDANVKSLRGEFSLKQAYDNARALFEENSDDVGELDFVTTKKGKTISVKDKAYSIDKSIIDSNEKLKSAIQTFAGSDYKTANFKENKIYLTKEQYETVKAALDGDIFADETFERNIKQVTENIVGVPGRGKKATLEEQMNYVLGLAGVQARYDESMFRALQTYGEARRAEYERVNSDEFKKDLDACFEADHVENLKDGKLKPAYEKLCENESFNATAVKLGYKDGRHMLLSANVLVGKGEAINEIRSGGKLGKLYSAMLVLSKMGFVQKVDYADGGVTKHMFVIPHSGNILGGIKDADALHTALVSTYKIAYAANAEDVKAAGNFLINVFLDRDVEIIPGKTARKFVVEYKPVEVEVKDGVASDKHDYKIDFLTNVKYKEGANKLLANILTVFASEGNNAIDRTQLIKLFEILGLNYEDIDASGNNAGIQTMKNYLEAYKNTGIITELAGKFEAHRNDKSVNVSQTDLNSFAAARDNVLRNKEIRDLLIKDKIVSDSFFRKLEDLNSFTLGQSGEESQNSKSVSLGEIIRSANGLEEYLNESDIRELAGYIIDVAKEATGINGLDDELVETLVNYRELMKSTVEYNKKDLVILNLARLETKTLHNLVRQLEMETYKQAVGEDSQKAFNNLAKSLSNNRVLNSLRNLCRLQKENSAGILTFDKNDEAQLNDFKNIMYGLGYEEKQINGMITAGRSTIPGISFTNSYSRGLLMKMTPQQYGTLMEKASAIYGKENQLMVETINKIDLKQTILDRFGTLLSDEQIKALTPEDLDNRFTIKQFADGRIELQNVKEIITAILKLGKAASQLDKTVNRIYENSYNSVFSGKALEKYGNALTLLNIIESIKLFGENSASGDSETGIYSFTIAKKDIDNIITDKIKTLYNVATMGVDDNTVKVVVAGVNANNWTLEYIINNFSSDGKIDLQKLFLLPYDKFTTESNTFRELTEQTYNSKEIDVEGLNANGANLLMFIQGQNFDRFNDVKDFYDFITQKELDLGKYTTEDVIKNELVSVVKKSLLEQNASIRKALVSKGFTDADFEIIYNREKLETLAQAIQNNMGEYKHLGVDTDGSFIIDKLNLAKIAQDSELDINSVKTIVSLLKTYMFTPEDNEDVFILQDVNAYTDIASIIRYDQTTGAAFISIDDILTMDKKQFEILNELGLVTKELKEKLSMVGKYDDNKGFVEITDDNIDYSAIRDRYQTGKETTRIMANGSGYIPNDTATQTALELMERSERNFLRNKESRFYNKLSSMNLESDMNKWLAKLLNVYTMNRIDNTGSALVADMDNRLAAGQLLNSIASLSYAIQDTILPDGTQLKLEPKAAAKLAMQIYFNTTGTDMSSAYNRYVMLYKDDNDEWHVENVGENMYGDRSLLSLGRQLSLKGILDGSTKYKEAYLFNASKNVMSSNAASYGENIKVMNMTEENINDLRNQVYLNAIAIAQEAGRLDLSKATNEQIADEIAKQLGSAYTRSEIRQLYYGYSKSAIVDYASKNLEGMDETLRATLLQRINQQVDALIGSTLETVENSQSASSLMTLREQAVAEIERRRGIISEERYNELMEKANKMVQDTEDAFTYFINKSSLPDNVIAKLDEFKNNAEAELKAISSSEFDLVKDVNEMFGDNSDIATTNIKRYLSGISDTNEKANAVSLIVKYAALKGERGKNIQFALLGDTKYVNDLKEAYEKQALKPGEIIVNGEIKPAVDYLGSGKKIISVDLENFFDSAKTKDGLIYDISFAAFEGSDEFKVTVPKRYRLFIKYDDLEYDDDNHTIKGYDTLASDPKASDEVKAAYDFYRKSNYRTNGKEHDSQDGQSKEFVYIVHVGKSSDKNAVINAINEIIKKATGGDAYTLVGHNAFKSDDKNLEKDLEKIRKQFGSVGMLEGDNVTHLDTLEFSKHGFLTDGKINETSLSLENLAREMGRTFNAHSAIDDAIFTYEYLLFKVGNQINVDRMRTGLYDDIEKVLKAIGAEDFDRNVLFDNITKLSFTDDEGNSSMKDFAFFWNQDQSLKDYRDAYSKYGVNLSSNLIKELLDNRNVVLSSDEARYIRKQVNGILEDILYQPQIEFISWLDKFDDKGISNLQNLRERMSLFVVPDSNGKVGYTEFKEGMKLMNGVYLAEIKNHDLKNSLDFFKLSTEEIDKALKDYAYKNGIRLPDEHADARSIADFVNDYATENNSQFVTDRADSEKYFAIKTISEVYDGITDSLHLDKLTPETKRMFLDVMSSLKTGSFKTAFKGDTNTFNIKYNGPMFKKNYWFNALEDAIDTFADSVAVDRRWTMPSGVLPGDEIKLANGETTKFSSTDIGLTKKYFEQLVGGSVEDYIESLGDAYKGELFIQIERSPGVGQNVVHTYRVRLLDNNNAQILLTPDIFAAFHGGDFDSDKILVLKPTKTVQKYGQQFLSATDKTWKAADQLISFLYKNHSYDVKKQIEELESFQKEHGNVSLKDLYEWALSGKPLSKSNQAILDEAIEKGFITRVDVSKYPTLKPDEKTNYLYYSDYISSTKSDEVKRRLSLDTKFLINQILAPKDSTTGYASKHYKLLLEGKAVRSSDASDLFTYNQLGFSGITLKRLANAMESNTEDIIKLVTTSIEDSFADSKKANVITEAVTSYFEDALRVPELSADAKANIVMNAYRLAELLYRQEDEDFNAMFNHKLNDRGEEIALIPNLIDEADMSSEREKLGRLIEYAKLNDVSLNESGIEYTADDLKNMSYNELNRLKYTIARNLDDTFEHRRFIGSSGSKQIANSIINKIRAQITSETDASKVKFIDGAEGKNYFSTEVLISGGIVKNLAADTFNYINTGRYHVARIDRIYADQFDLSKVDNERIQKAIDSYWHGKISLGKDSFIGNGERIVSVMLDDGSTRGADALFDETLRKQIKFINTEKVHGLKDNKIAMVGSGSLKGTIAKEIKSHGRYGIDADIDRLNEWHESNKEFFKFLDELDAMNIDKATRSKVKTLKDAIVAARKEQAELTAAYAEARKQFDAEQEAKGEQSWDDLYEEYSSASDKRRKQIEKLHGTIKRKYAPKISSQINLIIKNGQELLDLLSSLGFKNDINKNVATADKLYESIKENQLDPYYKKLQELKEYNQLKNLYWSERQAIADDINYKDKIILLDKLEELGIDPTAYADELETMSTAQLKNIIKGLSKISFVAASNLLDLKKQGANVPEYELVYYDKYMNEIKDPGQAAYTKVICRIFCPEANSFWDDSIKRKEFDPITFVNDRTNPDSLVMAHGKWYHKVKNADGSYDFIYDSKADNQVNRMIQKANTPWANSTNGTRVFRTMLAKVMYENCAAIKNEISEDDLLQNMLQGNSTSGSAGRYIIAKIFDAMTEDEVRKLYTSKDPSIRFLINKIKDFMPEMVEVNAEEFDTSKGLESKNKAKEIAKNKTLLYYYAKARGDILGDQAILNGNLTNEDGYPYIDNSDTFYSLEDFVTEYARSIGIKDKTLFRFKSKINEYTLQGLLNFANGTSGTQANGFNTQSYLDSIVYPRNHMAIAGIADSKAGDVSASIEKITPDQVILSQYAGFDKSIKDLLKANRSNDLLTSSSKNNFIRGNFYDTFTNPQNRKSNSELYPQQNMIQLAVLASTQKNRLAKAKLLTTAEDKIISDIAPRYFGYDADVGKIVYTANPQAFSGTYEQYQEAANNSFKGWARHDMVQPFADKLTQELAKEENFREKYVNSNQERLQADMEKAAELSGQMRRPSLDIDSLSKDDEIDMDYMAGGKIGDQTTEKYESQWDKTINSIKASRDIAEFDIDRMSSSNIKQPGMDRTIVAFNANTKSYRNQLLGKEFMDVVTVLNKNPSFRNGYNEYVRIKNLLTSLDYVNAKLSSGLKRNSSLEFYKENRNAIYKELGITRPEEVDAVRANLERYHKVYFQVDDMVKIVCDRLYAAQKAFCDATGQTCASREMFFLPRKISKSNGQNDTHNASILFSGTRKYNVNPFAIRKETGGLNPADAYTEFDMLTNMSTIATEVGRLQAMLTYREEAKMNGAMSNALSFDEACNVVGSKINVDELNNVGSTDKNSSEQQGFGAFLQSVYDQLKCNVTVSKSAKTACAKYADVYNQIYQQVIAPLKDSYGDISFNSLLSYSMSNPQDTNVDNALKAYSMMMDAVGKITTIQIELGQKTTIVDEIYSSVTKLAEEKGYVLVDQFGRKYDKDLSQFKALSPFATDDFIFRATHGGLATEGTYEQNVALDVLRGDLYFMDSTVAKQTEQLFYTREPSQVNKFMNTVKNIATKLIMANPAKFVSRMLNFSMFDLNSSLMTGNFEMMKYLPQMTKEISGYLQSNGEYCPDSLREFMNVTGIDPLKEQVFYGETTNKSKSAYLDFVGKQFTAQHLANRYALWLSLKDSIDKNGIESIYGRLGNSYYLKDQIKEMADNMAEPQQYNYTDAEGNQVIREVGSSPSARIAAFIVSNAYGTYGDMPGLAGSMSKHGFMFTTFPMALVRFAKREIQSGATAIKEVFTGSADTSTMKYLSRQVGSLASLIAIQVALQILPALLIAGNDEEEKKKLVDDVIENDTSIDMFQSILLNDAVFNTSTTWNPFYGVKSIFANPVIDAIKSHKNDNDSKAMNIIGDSLATYFNQNVWNRLNPLVTIIPNAALPTNKWTNPYGNQGTDFFDNLSRKALAYSLGTNGANAFVNTIDSDTYRNDPRFFDTLGRGFSNALQAELGNSKSYKSSWKNYNNAISILYKYRTSSDRASYDSKDSTFDKNYSSGLKAKLKNAMRIKSSPTVIYGILKDAIDSHASQDEIKQAIESVSVKMQIQKLSSQSDFFNSLSQKDYNVIRSALAYEDSVFPTLEDLYIESYQDQIKNRINNSTPKFKQTNYSLKTYGYNYPTYRSSNYKTSRKNHYYNNLNNWNTNTYKNKYNQQLNPFEAYNKAQQNIAYGTSTDVWGNETRHYTDGTTYNVRQPGMPFPGGNK